jgi:hypothetical protein
MTNNKMIAGAAVTQGNIQNWTAVFADRTGTELGLLTQHNYPLNYSATSGARAPTVANLLSEYGRRRFEASYAADVQEIAEPLRLPWRMAETNSCNGGGKEGVSDTLASALWALDYIYTMAGYESSGVDFHAGRMGGYSGSPIKVWHNTVTAQPLYYALLMFRQAGRGRLVPLDVAAKGVNLTAYAAMDENKVLRVTLINKDLKENADVIITPGQDYHSVSGMRLQGRSLYSGDNITLDGAAVGPDGSWAPSESLRQITQFDQDFFTTVPSGSAIFVTFKPSN